MRPAKPWRWWTSAPSCCLRGRSGLNASCTLELRFGAVDLARPQSKFLRHLPESLPLTLVDVREIDPRPVSSRCTGGFSPLIR